jgi:hypothetical protein
VVLDTLRSFGQHIVARGGVSTARLTETVLAEARLLAPPHVDIAPAWFATPWRSSAARIRRGQRQKLSYVKLMVDNDLSYRLADALPAIFETSTRL